MPQFTHYDLRLLNPSFSSPLLDVLTDLEHLRRLQLHVSTPIPVFTQLKQVFHLLESLASARIEGNHTTLADYVEATVAPAQHRSDPLQEIDNIDSAMDSVEAVLEPGADITEHLLRGLHSMTVEDLVREGDRTPGAYRTGPVQIAQSEHLPPEAIHVPAYMAELVAFINRADPPKYDLMKVALAHHRFAWIHPFGNGNGRVVRLLTYASLLKFGFRVSLQNGQIGRLLNPAAVFCADRERYYAMLALADVGSDESLEAWCTYVLTGVRDELAKVDRLAEYDYLQTKILLPAVSHARERQLITAQEATVLTATVKSGIIKAGDLGGSLPDLSANQRTYQIKKLVANGMLQPISPNARQYTIGFSHNLLLRGVVRSLTEEGFISPTLAGHQRAVA